MGGKHALSVAGLNRSPQGGGGRRVRLAIKKYIENDVEIKQDAPLHPYFSMMCAR